MSKIWGFTIESNIDLYAVVYSSSSYLKVFSYSY